MKKLAPNQTQEKPNKTIEEKQSDLNQQPSKNHITQSVIKETISTSADEQLKTPLYYASLLRKIASLYFDEIEIGYFRLSRFLKHIISENDTVKSALLATLKNFSICSKKEIQLSLISFVGLAIEKRKKCSDKINLVETDSLILIAIQIIQPEETTSYDISILMDALYDDLSIHNNENNLASFIINIHQHIRSLVTFQEDGPTCANAIIASFLVKCYSNKKYHITDPTMTSSDLINLLNIYQKNTNFRIEDIAPLLTVKIKHFCPVNAIEDLILLFLDIPARTEEEIGYCHGLGMMAIINFLFGSEEFLNFCSLLQYISELNITDFQKDKLLESKRFKKFNVLNFLKTLIALQSPTRVQSFFPFDKTPLEQHHIDTILSVIQSKELLGKETPENIDSFLQGYSEKTFYHYITGFSQLKIKSRIAIRLSQPRHVIMIALDPSKKWTFLSNFKVIDELDPEPLTQIIFSIFRPDAKGYNFLNSIIYATKNNAPTIKKFASYWQDWNKLNTRSALKTGKWGPNYTLDPKGYYLVHSLLNLSMLTDAPNLINLFLEEGFLTDYEDIHEETLLHSAAQYGSTKVITCLIENKKEDQKKYANKKDTANNTPLLIAAINDECTIDLLELFLSYGADIDYAGEVDQTILHWLMDNWCLHLNVINFLVKKGANLTLKNIYGNTAFSNAVRGDDFDSSAPNKQEIVKLILKKEPKLVNEKNNKGETLLHNAVYSAENRAEKYIELIKLLLNDTYKTDVNAVDKQGLTPLDIAEQKKLTEIKQLLLEKKALRGRDLQKQSTDSNIACLNTSTTHKGSKRKHTDSMTTDVDPNASRTKHPRLERKENTSLQVETTTQVGSTQARDSIFFSPNFNTKQKSELDSSSPSEQISNNTLGMTG